MHIDLTALVISMQVQLPIEWVLGILVTILAAILTSLGGLVKIAYDTSKRVETVLKGQQNGEKGFIPRQRNKNEQLHESHTEMLEEIRIQGELLSQLTYAFADISSDLDDETEIDVDVDMERIEQLHQRKRDRQIHNQNADGSNTKTKT
jgi:hypothetical protein